MSVDTNAVSRAQLPNPQSRDEQYLFHFVGASNGEMQTEQDVAPEVRGIEDRIRSGGAVLLFSMIDERPTTTSDAFLTAALDKMATVDTIGLAKFLHVEAHQIDDEQSERERARRRKKMLAVDSLSELLRRQLCEIVIAGDVSEEAGSEANQGFADRVDNLSCLLLGVQQDDLTEAYRRLETIDGYEDDLFSCEVLLRKFLCTIVRRYLEIDWGGAVPSLASRELFVAAASC